MSKTRRQLDCLDVPQVLAQFVVDHFGFGQLSLIHLSKDMASRLTVEQESGMGP